MVNKPPTNNNNNNNNNNRMNTPTTRKRLLDQTQDQSILWVDRIQNHSNNLTTTNNNNTPSSPSTNSSNSSFHSTSSQPNQQQQQQQYPPSPSASSSTSTSSYSPSSSAFPSSASSFTSPANTTRQTILSTNSIINTNNNNNKNNNNNTFKRTRAIEELVETEAIYASDLVIIRDIYLYRASGPPPSPPTLSTNDRQIIFSNITQLTQLALSLSEALTQANTQNQIGSCFIEFLPKIEKLFTVYCSKYGPASKRLEEFTRKLDRKQKKLDKSSSSNSGHHNHNHHHHHHHLHKPREEQLGIKYLNDCKKLCEGRTSAWDLGSLLIKPVQRCLKYSLLLDQIIKYTESDDPDLSSLIKARDGMVRVADSINETKRRHEVVGEMISRSGPLGSRYGVRLGSGSSNNSRPTGGKCWPSPPGLAELIDQVRRSAKALDQLPLVLIGSQNSIVDWIVAADRLVDAFKHTFALSSSPAAPPPPGILLSDLQAYQHLVLRGSLNGPLKFLRERIKKEIIPRIEELKGLYTKPLMLIEKYEKRRQMIGSPSHHPTSPTSSTSRTRRRSEGGGGSGTDQPIFPLSSASSFSSHPLQPSSHTTTPISIPSSSSSSSTAATSTTTAATSTTTTTTAATLATDDGMDYQLKEIQRFLLDQLPKLIQLSNSALNRILANLFRSAQLCHSDLIVLINKALNI
ncbi:hypothetical protein PGT21_035253 [Puccinia graminis f. sp. tritici]|uniref:DH domain-containing protein n=1 Tax=Puccinia graminis f. sp. tritici TaxID=56615 RepID=A0A5B0N691_PUCGR|nr:hypothetical protein PGTUg99_024419 [Puccinia graminis f. sp. tritici]KAA1084771.1 hypothetical protein PGT21_035253 [Puccinia graminis f. sp. tritici]